MYRNWKKLLKNSALLLSLFLFTNCSSINSKPQFAITKPVYKKGANGESCKVAGVYFDFINKAASEVNYIKIQMNLFDKATEKNAFIDQGTITSEMNCSIPEYETKNLCIPLDEYITIVSDSDYFIDQFIVKEVHYADGSEYSDYFGVYATQGESK